MTTVSDSSDSPQSSSPKSPVRLSVGKKCLFGLIVTASFFVAVEIGLGVLGVSREIETTDPYVGFSSRIPLFKPTSSSGGTFVSTASNKLDWFNEQRFAIKKAPNTKRVFCVGGSTTYGRPYGDETSFCGWLRELLPLVDTSTQWEVINAGGVSYASYRVAVVVEELSQYQPDVIIVYCGQNEFLERRTYANMFDQSTLHRGVGSVLSQTRTWSVLRKALGQNSGKKEQGKDRPAETLPGEVDEMLNHSVGPADYHRDDDWHAKVLKHYESNLQRIIAISRNAGAKVVFVVPASNEKDCSPFKSELATSLTVEQRDEYSQLYEQASQAYADKDIDTAIRLLNEAKKIDAEYADADFQIGKMLFERGSVQEAATAFHDALDCDVCPLRAPRSFTLAVKAVADKNDVTCVDYPSLLRQKCQEEYGHEALGNEYFLDHVHPTIEAHQMLSLWIIQAGQANNVIGGSAATDEMIAKASTNVMSRIDPAKQAASRRNLAKVLHWAGKFTEAEPHAIAALDFFQDDPESLLILADCYAQTNRDEDAISIYDRLFEVAPIYGRGYMPYGELLFRRQAYSLAESYLTMAVLSLPENSVQLVRAQLYLGATQVKQGNFAEAESILLPICEKHPENAELLFYFAQAKAGLGKSQAAIDLYKRVLKQAPRDTESMHLLGKLLLNSKRPKEAMGYFQSVLEIKPNDRDAAAHLKIAEQLVK